MSEWIKCSERLPPYDETVLLCCLWAGNKETRPYVETGYRYSTDKCGEHWADPRSREKVSGFRVTHWMPLPKTPASQDKGTP